MQALQTGESGALEILYERYFQRLCAFAFSVFQIPQPEDLVQDVYVKIIENPQLFKTQYKFQTWIFTLVSNRCKNHRRTEISRDINASEFYKTTISEQQHENLDALQIKKSIEKVWSTLSEKEKSIYALKYDQNFTHKEIAEIMEIPEGSVKSGIFYILKKMALQLKPHIKNENKN